MPIPRFYCSTLPHGGATFDLPPEAAHHAMRVLRLREGERVEIFDGLGNACRGVLAELDGKRVVVGGIVVGGTDRESPLPLLLAHALSGGEKMDWVIQKATELGVAEIQPLDTERSVAKLPADRAAKRLEHWRQVAISACEQCGRNRLPDIRAPQDIMVWLSRQSGSRDSKLILLPEGAASLRDQARPQGKAVLLVGAEGGFTGAESEAALRCGFAPIRLGARVLRTETAAVAGLAALQTLWGDFWEPL